MAIRTTEAVVLKTQPFRDTSLIVTFFTKDFGKVQGIAKGIRVRCERKDSRFYCYLEPLTLNKIVYYQKNRSALHLLTQADLLNQFQPIRKDLKKLATASFMLELVDKGTQLEDVNEEIFKLLVNTLSRLCEEPSPCAQGLGLDQVLLFFETEFLKLSGLLPQGQKSKESIRDFIKIYIDSEFKALEFMEKINR